MEKKKDNDDIKLTKLFMAKINWQRKYMGTYNDYTNADGSKFVCGKVYIEDGDCWATANDKYELSRLMDAICKLKLECRLHDNDGESEVIAGSPFFLN
jgi:hypothetical protein